MEHSETIANLATALSQAQAEMPPVPFDKENGFLHNKYATLGAMIETARPILSKFGLSVSQLVVSYDGQMGVETILMHQSGEWISNVAILPPGEEKGKSNAQVAGSTITYLRRYSYAAILGLYADEDTDGNQPQPHSQQNAKQGTQKPPQGNKQPSLATEPYSSQVTIPGNARLCDLDGAQLYAIQQGGPEKFNIHQKHFDNRFKKRFGVRALKDITATVNEFIKVMTPNDDTEAQSTLDAFFGAESTDDAIEAIRGR